MNGHHYLPALPTLPEDYAWQDDALVFMRSDGKDNQATVISQFPIYLHAVQKSESRDMVNLSFRQRKPHDGWSTFSLSAGELRGPRSASILADRGANLSDHKAFTQYVIKAVDAYHASAKMSNTFEQMGWKNNDTCFLLGTTLYGPEGKRTVDTSDELRLRGKDLGPQEGGSLAEWKRAINPLFAAGCEAQSFSVLAGLGAPLIRYLDPTEGGAVVSVVSTESGEGKSTGAIGATSIYGRKAALSVEKSFSSVARGLTFASLGNVVCIHDELRARDPDVLRDFIIDYTSGTDKRRATRSGELKQAAATWQSILITCDNYSLLDCLSVGAVEHDEAPALRVIELPLSIPQGMRKLYKEEIKEVLENNSGYAADAYLSFITKPEVLVKIRGLLKEMYMSLFKDTGWVHKHRFWVRTLACAAVGGIIARRLGLIECSVDRIIRWAIKVLAERADPEKKLWQVGALGHYLNSHLGERLSVDDAWTAGRRCVVMIEPRKGKLSIRHEQKRNRFLIAATSLREHCVEHGLNYTELYHYLNDNGIITGRLKVVLGAGTDYAGAQVWTIAIDGNHPLLTGLPQLAWSSSHDRQSHGPDAAAPRQQSAVSIPPND